MKRKTISDPVGETRLAATRGLKARGDAPAVDREGGKYGAGIIRGVSMITRGEALGHRSWIDATTLSQVAERINLAGPKGIKSRFTHPSMSADGLGSMIGYAIGPAEVRDGQVISDVHLTKASRETPQGDLGGYVMNLADESPEAFGTSIVFAHDRDAEDAFEAEHLADVEHEDSKGRKSKRQEFRSPDPDNVNHYRHVRIGKLRAVDAVDEPAANPAGLFSRGQDIAREADAFLSYCLGLSCDRPDVSKFGVDPDRAAAYVARFLESRGLSVKGESMSKEVTAAEAPKPEATPAPAPAITRESYAAELQKYVEAFGAENGAKWFAAGKPMLECYDEHSKALAKRAEDAEAKALAAANAAKEVKLGEVPVSVTDATAKPNTLASCFRIK